MSEIVLDPNGKPFAKIVVCVSEKIGLPNYSNVDLGPISMTRYVEDNEAARTEAFKMMTREVEAVVAQERAHVLSALGHNLADAKKP